MSDEMHSNDVLGAGQVPHQYQGQGLGFVTSLDFRLLFELNSKQLVPPCSGLSHQEREMHGEYLKCSK